MRFPGIDGKVFDQIVNELMAIDPLDSLRGLSLQLATMAGNDTIERTTGRGGTQIFPMNDTWWRRDWFEVDHD